MPSNPIAYPTADVFTIVDEDAVAHYVFVPDTYDASHNTPATLFVWLHGSGGAGAGDIWNISPGGAGGQSWISMAVGGTEGGNWNSDMALGVKTVMAALAQIKTHFNINPSTVVLGGYSAGGDLAYRTAFENALSFAGLIVTNTSPFSDTGVPQATLLAGAAWKFNVAHIAHLSDAVYLIANVRTETDVLTTNSYPITRLEKAGTHFDADVGAFGTIYDLRTFGLPFLNLGWTVPASLTVPSVVAVVPATGSTAGGTIVVIQVNSSAGCTGGTLGGTALTSFSILDATHVQGTSGAHASGAVSATVTNSTGPSAALASAFTYSAASTNGLYLSGVQYRGINRAGAEYGSGWNGWTGQTWYQWPSSSELADELSYLTLKGFNIIRLPISWERLQHAVNGELDATYKAALLAFVSQANTAKFMVLIDLHNYNRYATGAGANNTSGYTQHILGDGILTVAHLTDVWTKLSTLFVGNPLVMFAIMNEPHDFNIMSTDWFANCQTILNAIRATGCTQLVLIPNSRGSDVTHWNEYSPNGGPLDSDAAGSIIDSANNIAYDMHAYLDAPTNGSAYSTLLTKVTQWATTKGTKLFLSEFGTPQGAVNGNSAMSGLLAYLNAHSAVWVGWTVWNLMPYNLTLDAGKPLDPHDGPSMAWFTPYLTPNIVTN